MSRPDHPVDLVSEIRRIAREEAHAVLATLSTAGVYRSRGGVLPPGVSTARGMRDRIRRYGIDHTVEGTGTHAVYICTHAQWAAGMRRPGKLKAPTLRLVPTADEDLADAAMTAAGLRSTRSSR